MARRIELCPLYYAARRPVVDRDGTLIVVDDAATMRWKDGEEAETKLVRFRTLGCWPVTGAIESPAENSLDILKETVASRTSERRGRISDEGSLEKQKRAGYF